MLFHILTLFPEMVLQGLQTSILGRACEKGILSFDAVNIRDFTLDKHNRVDDHPYGGGAGMLMQAQPIYDAWRSLAEKRCSDRPLRVIYLTPQGRVFDQEMAREFAQEGELAFLCGHYEGVDERVLEEIVTDQVSIGDYVLTGGELAAMVMIDAISRMVPGVLHNGESGETESFHENLLEYPQYTRPEVWRDRKVPEVLLSGDHAKVDAWRLERSVERTKLWRPDLYEKYDLPGRALSYLMEDRLFHMDMIEDIRRGQAEVLAVREDGVILRDVPTGIYMVTAETKDAGERLLSLAGKDAEVFACHQDFVAESVAARFGKSYVNECFQAVYTRKQRFQEDENFLIRPLTEEDLERIAAHYELCTKEELRTALQRGDIFGAFVREGTEAACHEPLGTPEESGAEGARTADGAGTEDARKADGTGAEGTCTAESTGAEGTRTAESTGADSGPVCAGFIGTHREGGMGLLYVRKPYRRLGAAMALEKFLVNRTLEKGWTPYGQIFSENEASIRLQEKLGFRLCRRKIYWIS